MAVFAHVTRGAVSIHAPARGATRPCGAFQGTEKSFNPRAREGRDHTLRSPGKGAGVSIHAPARGATTGARRTREQERRFNPRAREGRDLHGSLAFFLT